MRDLTVGGSSTVKGNQEVQRDLTVGGNSTVKGNQTVGGTITANKGIIGGVILETTAEDGKSKITAQKADIDGVWIKEGSITTEEGTITAGDVVINSAGSEKINVGNGNFIVYEDGAVRAADDNFIVHKDGSVEAQGTVQAADATNFEVGSRELVTAGQLAAAGIVPGTAFENGVAIGENAMATAAYTVAVGEGSQAFGNSSTALGYDTHVDASAKNAVALGANSVADRADTVSVGSKDNERQITNVAAGTASTDAVNVKQLTDRTANMVEWDEGTDDTIHGVTLENGMITAADGKFKVYGTGGIYAADGKFQVNGNTGDVSAEGNLKAADGKFFVNGENGSIKAADGDFKVSSKGDVTAAGSLTAADEKFKVYGASGGFMAADGKVEVNGYTGDIRTDGKVTANEIHAANDNFIVYESGVVKLNGGNLVIGTNGDLNSKGTITGNVLSTGGFVANADGNAEAKGTVTANTLSTGADGFIANSDGDFEARNAHIDGTLLVGEKFKVTPDGELIAANSAFKVGADGTVTAVRGGSIGGVELKDGEVTGLNNTMWDAGDIVNDRAATEGQLAVVDAQVNANSDELTKYKNAGIVAGGASEIGNGIALGARSSANAGSIAVGDMAWVMGKDSVGLGNDISVGGSDAVAIGNNINLVANNSVALGNGSAAARENTVSVGSSGNERQITNVAAGTEGTDAVNVNQLNEVKSSVTSVGDDLAAYKAAGIVPGAAVPEDVEGAMALGEGSEAVNANAVAVGPSAKASGSFSLAFGAGATTDGANAIALGKGTEASAKNSIAVGAEANASSHDSIAIGTESSVAEGSHEGVALGYHAAVSKNGSVAIGSKSSAAGELSMALGLEARTELGASGSVALGAASVATGVNEVSVGNDTLKRKITNVDAGTADTDAVNVSQIKGMVKWDEGTEDTIKGVTLNNGTITAADGNFHVWKSGGIAVGETDNYLFTVNGYTGAITTQGGITAANENFKVEGSGQIITESGITAANDKFHVWNSGGIAIGEDTSNPLFSVNGYNGDVKTQGNVVAKGMITAANGNLVVKDDPNSDIDSILNIGEGAFRVNENGGFNVNDGAFAVYSQGGFSAASGQFKVTAGNEELPAGAVTTPLVTGLTNKNWNATHDYSESDRAATEAQLQAVADEAGKHTEVTTSGDNLTLKETVTDGQTTYDISLSDTVTVGNNTKGVTLNGDATNGDPALSVVTPGVSLGRTLSFDFSSAGAVFKETHAGAESSTTINGSEITAQHYVVDENNQQQLSQTTINGGIVTVSSSEADEDRTTIKGADITVGSAVGGAAQTHITSNEITIGGDVDKDFNRTALRITNNGETDRTITGLTNMTWKSDEEWQKTHYDPSRAATEGQLAGIQEQVTANRTDINDLTTKFNKAGINTNSLEKAVAVANQLDGANLSALSALSQISPMNMAAPMNAAVPTRNPNVEGESGESGTTGDTSRVPVDGLTVTDDQISTDRDFSVGGNLSVSGDTTLGGKLTVKGEATFNKNVSINGDLNMNKHKITGVAAGDVNATSTDAVNGSQLYGVQQDVKANSQNISSLGGAVNKLGNRIDEVGAGAAALAALHPLDFDPDNKWDFSAGYGNYRGESAVAFGAFYRPNEDTMFSVGGTVGNDDNMVNAGVSLKIGSGSSGVTTSRVAMAKEIKAMRDVVAKQDAQIQKLTAMVNALVGIEAEPDTTTMFPDVPENHWAYEAVAAMARSGLVKGYPDGEFKGDRTMTRYEFAQIIQNAIQAGAEVDSRLVEEFKPELEYFHIATVAKDKDGNPTIERVRAN